MQPPRLADTAERDYFTSGLIAMQKQLEGTPEILMSSANRFISMGNSCNYCEQPHALRSINA